MLPRSEVFFASAQDVADPVERIVLTAAMPVDVLLYAATDFIDRGGGEFHDMERVQHRSRVFELVINRVLVAVERISGRDLDLCPERIAMVVEPGLVHLARAPRHQIQQSCPDLAGGVTGQIHHAGELFRAAATPRLPAGWTHDATCVRPRPTR